VVSEPRILSNKLLMNREKLEKWAVSLLRIAVGWHFLYEGIVKLISPGWTSAGYLNNANWIFSGLFHQLAANADLISVVDFLNIWGLIFIGTGLMLGLGIRISSVAGILLLLLYYIVSPSLIGLKYSSVSSEGSYLIVNKNLIEALVLVVFLFSSPGKHIGLHMIYRWVLEKRRLIKLKRMGTIPAMTADSGSRRKMLQSLLVLPLAVLFGYTFAKKKSIVKADSFTSATTLIMPDTSVAEMAKDDLFTGKLGSETVSRLILGGGCFFGWQHARDLKYVNELALNYNTQSI
jgi:uncharacterized membrane protein YphA (DoxX/SURF4 family)